MKKLIEGIKLFRQKATPRQLQQFSILALEQKPDALFIACS
ncbi:MAG: carbonic anhydrase, partial [Deltaproteobacteria bacterium CG_4_9_14_0_2_um_filter_42_21]